MKVQKLESTMLHRNLSVNLKNEEMLGYIFRKGLEYKEPFSQNEDFTTVKQIKEEHICRKCSKSFTSKTDLETHIENACDKVKIHTCNLCNMSFGENNSLQKHIKTVHAETKTFSCTLCDKRLSVVIRAFHNGE